MTPHPVRRFLSAPRSRGLAITCSVLALLTMFCLQLVASNRAAWQSVSEPGPATVDQALAALCGSLALVIALWLLSALLLSLLAALGSGSSAASAALSSGARVLAPRVLRNAVAALLGVAIAAAPAAADVTGARAPSGAATAQLHRSQGAGQDLGLSPVWTPTTPETVTPRSDLLPGWLAGISPSPGADQSRSAQAQSESSPSERTHSRRTRSGHPGSAQAGPMASASGATGSAPMPSPARRTRSDPDGEIVVRRGDTLWSLAERHLGPGATDGEIAVEWPHWFTANRAVIGGNPDHLVPGERLRPPERDAPSEPYRTETRTETRTGTGIETSPGAWSRADTRNGARAKVVSGVANGTRGPLRSGSRGGIESDGGTGMRCDAAMRLDAGMRIAPETGPPQQPATADAKGGVEIRGAW